MTARTLLLFLSAVTLAATAFAQSSIDVTHYDGVIRFDLQNTQLEGRVTLLITRAAQDFDLHLRDLTVDEVRVNLAPASFTQSDGLLHIHAAAAPAPGDTISVDIAYGGIATSEAGPSSWGGCFWGNPSFAMGVGFYAPYVSMTRHWLPSNDIPSDKATFDLIFVVPSPYVAAGTGRLTEIGYDTGWTGYRWVESHPTATYLVTYAIDRYARITADWKGLPLEYYVPTA
jgi:aminopeptidase N